MGGRSNSDVMLQHFGMLIHALLRGEPYFGPALATTQGPPVRKAYMRALVELLAHERPAMPVRVLEIGSWAGASAVTWAQAIRDFAGDGEVTCVDLWKPYFDLLINRSDVYLTMEKAAESGDIYRLFQHNIRAAGVEDLIDCIIGDSRQVLPTLCADEYDIIFIDGAHVYDIVSSDIANAKRLVRDGGIVCGDDLELTLAEVDQDRHRAALKVGADFALDVRTCKEYHPAVTQAVADEFPNLTNFEGLWAVRRQGETFKPVDLSASTLEIPTHLRAIEVNAPPGGRDGVVELLFSHKDFYILRHRDGYLAIAQKIGEVDASKELEQIRALYHADDVLIGGSIEYLIRRIGELTERDRRAAEVATRIELLAQAQQRLESQMTATAERAAVQVEAQQRLESRMTTMTEQAAAQVEVRQRLEKELEISSQGLCTRMDNFAATLAEHQRAIDRGRRSFAYRCLWWLGFFRSAEK